MREKILVQWLKAIYAGKDTNVLVHFRDLLDKISIIDLEKRLSVSRASEHYI